MATLTSNAYLDDAARTAGETFTLNGGVLTVRTDTRVHANAPASMTGAIGATTISATLGGGVILDGTDVRWMPFSSGSGNVPAIGTTVTQGGVSGYLLGVWDSLTSAPSAVGGAMPTTGFLKFREVTGGPYSAGALTGIGASADSADVAGWIEVVQRQAVANTVPRLGFFRTRGDWFYLDDTNGAANQVLQVPTNGGGAGTHVPAVWIETGVGTNVYEVYPAVRSTWFLAANLSTDERSKFVQTLGSGQVRIGYDGADNAGYVPPAGCKVRIPNVIGRQSTSAGGDANNQVPSASLGTRPDFNTTSAGDIDFEYFINDWYNLFTAPFRVRMINCATFDIHSTSNEASPKEIDGFGIGAYNGTSIALSMTNNPLGGTIENAYFPRAGAASNGHSVQMVGCSNFEFNNVKTGIIQYARSSGLFSLNQCRNIVLNDVTVHCESLALATSSNIEINNLVYLDRILGAANSTTAKYMIVCSVSCDNITLDGVSFGTVADNNPYSGLFNAANCSNLTFRNAGTLASPLDVNASAAPAYIYADSGNNDGVRVQRCYINANRTNNFLTVNTTKNLTIENCSATTGAVQTLAINAVVKGIRAASNSVTGGAAVYGTHWFDMFESDTQGRLWLAFNEPTEFSEDQYEAVSLGTGAGFTSSGNLVMPNLSDEVIWTMPYFCIGHTAFDNSAPTITGTNTGNFTLTYDIDTGAGFSGSYSTLNATNLSAESINPTIGFKLKIKVAVNSANASNALRYIRITTDSTLSDQQANLYPMDYTTISLTGLVAGSRVQLYDLDGTAEIYNEIVSGTSLAYSTPYVSDFDCRVRIMHVDGTDAYHLLEFNEPVGVDGFTRAVSQAVDSVYAANGIDGSTITTVTIDDDNLLVEVDTGTITWAQIYAYETYWLFTEEGIRDESRFIEAGDTANYKIFDFAIKNVSDPSAPLIISGGYAVDGDTGNSIDIIDITGGTIFCAPDHVVPFETSGGGGGGGASAADVWSYGTRTLTSGAAPSAATVATAVRTELATELSRIDADITTRLSDASYIAPDNASILEIKTKTDALPSDPADQSVIIAATDLIRSDISAIPAAPSAGTISTQILSDLDPELTMIDELHKIQGLKSGVPMTVTQTTRIAGDIELAITGDGETTTTVTRP